MTFALPIVSPPIFHHVKYLERREVVLALKRGALLFTFRNDRSSPCLYNSYGGLVFFFPKRMRDGAIEINAHDSTRRADLRVSTTDNNRNLTAIVTLPGRAEARVSLAGGMFGPNGDGNALMLAGDVPVVAVSTSCEKNVSPVVIVDKDTYFVAIAPGFDISLAVAACLIFEELGRC
ncbi:hypothetical protein CcaverHIS631_0700630 [Cutaneotrichosporon cavernicola]|nr:hypothetical protein CcaverHIS631_0700630 [Cutaneotrichosporon cavernicola]BEJ10027.1 hypothetical protein CcaverHIS641_0700620 [Cutaneotrichosporon cavernicola]